MVKEMFLNFIVMVMLFFTFVPFYVLALAIAYIFALI